MKSLKVISVLLIALGILYLVFFNRTNKIAEQQNNKQTDCVVRNPESKELYKKKICFEPNVGQTDSTIHFISRGKDYTLFLGHNEALFRLFKTDPDEQENLLTSMRMQLENANPQAESYGKDKLERKSNYYIGNNPELWQTGIDNFSSVEYKDVYPGIDLIYYGNEGLLEYDFIVASGADPGEIVLKFDSPQEYNIDMQGNLVFDFYGKHLTLKKPVAYQLIADKRRNIESNFHFLAENKVGFNVGRYNKSYPLVIDPVLVWASYLGGSITSG